MVQLHNLHATLATGEMSEVLINMQSFCLTLFTLIIYSTSCIVLLHLYQKCNDEKEIVSGLKTKPNQTKPKKSQPQFQEEHKKPSQSKRKIYFTLQ